MNNREKLDISLLGFLYEKSMHGYDIYKEITKLSGVGIVWRVKTGKLYAMLHRLEDHGWVTPKVAQEGNRPQKTQYIITKNGKAAFDGWLLTPVQHGRDFRITFLLKLYFAMDRGIAIARKLILEQKSLCQEWVKLFKSEQAEGNNKEVFNKVVFLLGQR